MKFKKITRFCRGCCLIFQPYFFCSFSQSNLAFPGWNFFAKSGKSSKEDNLSADRRTQFPKSFPRKITPLNAYFSLQLVRRFKFQPPPPAYNRYRRNGDEWAFMEMAGGGAWIVEFGINANNPSDDALFAFLLLFLCVVGPLAFVVCLLVAFSVSLCLSYGPAWFDVNFSRCRRN